MKESENLSDEHVEHLQNIGYGGLMRTVTPPHIERHFLMHGFVKKAAGGLMITDAGHHALISWDEND